MAAGSIALEPEILDVNGVRLNLQTREVICNGMPVDLTSIEYEILEMLVRSAGRVVLREHLERILRDRHAKPFEHALDPHVSELRRKLERGRHLIRTVPGVGYVFAAADESAPSRYQLA